MKKMPLMIYSLSSSYVVFKTYILYCFTEESDLFFVVVVLVRGRVQYIMLSPF